MIRILTLCFTLLTFITAINSGTAQAASLNELRASGAVGDRYDGYAVVRESAPGATRIVVRVNTKRSRIYNKRAKQQGISAAQVGEIYARQIHDKAPAGTWFLSKDGSWSRK